MNTRGVAQVGVRLLALWVVLQVVDMAGSWAVALIEAPTEVWRTQTWLVGSGVMAVYLVIAAALWRAAPNLAGRMVPAEFGGPAPGGGPEADVLYGALFAGVGVFIISQAVPALATALAGIFQTHQYAIANHMTMLSTPNLNWVGPTAKALFGVFLLLGARGLGRMACRVRNAGWEER